MGYIIEAHGLVKSYPGKDRAVDGLSFRVQPGEVYGLLGPNGAGKSSTVRMLATLSAPDLSYRSFLTPGIVVMGALMSAGWAGVGVISDIDRGVLDRFLASRVRRSALVTGRLNHLMVTTVIQTIIIVVALLTGVTLGGGVTGWGVLLLAAVLIAAPVGALSCAMSVTTRQEETVIGAVQFVLMPLTFLSSVFIPYELMPDWIATTARFNPADWAVTASRSALSSRPDWAFIGLRLGGLAVLTVACTALATRAFRSYHRSL